MGKKQIIKFFVIMLQVGCIGFGGGSSLIPILHHKLVKEHAFLPEEEFDEIVMIASITPGALPVEIAGGTGGRLYGWLGTLVGAYGIALPGVLGTLMLVACMGKLSGIAQTQFQYVSVGVFSLVCVLLMDYVLKCFDSNNQNKEKNNICITFVIMSVFLLTVGKYAYKLFDAKIVPLFGLSTIDIFILTFLIIGILSERKSIYTVVTTGILGLFYVVLHKGSIYSETFHVFFCIYRYVVIIVVCIVIRVLLKDSKESSKGIERKPLRHMIPFFIQLFFLMIPICVVLKNPLQFVGKGLLSTVLSYGGGDAYLVVAEGIFVDCGIVSNSYYFENVVSIANILPGSVLCKVLSSIGFYIGITESGSVFGGLLVALLGFSISVMTSCGSYFVCEKLINHIGEVSLLVIVKQWIRPVFSGLMLTVICSMLCQIKSFGGNTYILVMLAISFIGMFLKDKKVGIGVVMLIMVGSSLLICNVLSTI